MCAAVLKHFGLFDPFVLLKIIEDPKGFLFLWILSIFIILEIKREKFSKYLWTHLQITKIYQSHANINNTFYEKQRFLPKQKIIDWEELASFCTFATLFNTWLQRRHEFSYLVLPLFCCSILLGILKTMKKIWPHIVDMSLEKIRSCTFSNKCGYSLILHQNSTRSIFWQVGYSGQFETISANFSHIVMLKSTGISCALRGSFTRAWFHVILGKYWFTQYASLPKMLTHVIIQYQKPTFANITINLIRKAFKF